MLLFLMDYRLSTYLQTKDCVGGGILVTMFVCVTLGVTGGERNECVFDSVLFNEFSDFLVKWMM